MRTVAISILIMMAAGCGGAGSDVEQEFDIDAYMEEAKEHLATLTRGHQTSWGLGSADWWDADQETGMITWSFSDGRIVESPFQIIGTYSTKDGTFLWGWDHPSVTEPVRKDAQLVLDFGREHDLGFLQERKLECSEEAAWDLVALAVLICDRQGAYRGTAGTTSILMTFGEVAIRQ